MSDIINVSRRDFLKSGAAIGGGLVLGLSLPLHRNRAEAAEKGELSALNAFVRVGSDNSVTIIVNHSEMGQGVYTSLPMLVAEELECDWKNVRVEAAPVEPVYNHTQFGIQATGGSTSVRTEWDRLRKAGATAREMLIAAAADTWKVDKQSCRADNGTVVHSSGKKLTYGELAGKAAAQPVPKDVPVKDPSKFKLIGKPVRRLDALEKVTGKAVFGCDVRLPDMLTALVARPPVFGGKVARFKDEKAKVVAGVRHVVQIPEGVAVIADGLVAAKEGRESLEIVWDDGPNAKLSTEGLRKEYAKLAEKPGTVARKEGDIKAGLKNAKKRLTAEYEVPYLAHACLEPLNCTVSVSADGCDIWTGTQFQTVDRNAAAKAAGLKPEQVKLHTMYLGGGFGRRANPHSDFVVEAVNVGKAIKKPVKVMWLREDDTKGGFYRPVWRDRMVGGIDDKGNVAAWHHTIVGQSIISGTMFEKAFIKDGVDQASVEGAKEIPYGIPNILVDIHGPDVGVPVQWWRSVGHSHNAFVVECFFDELADAAGKDPYELRMNMLAKHPRQARVLETAAKKAGWGEPLPKGRARGIALHESYGSFVAQVAEVSVGKDGKIRVPRVVCAIDCGRIVNPDIINAQMESGIAFGLSAALHGEITLSNGRVDQSNYDDYPILRLDEMPQVEVWIVPSTEALGGVGEVAVPPIAPAVGNAIFALTGKRLRSLPFKSDGLVAK